MSERNPRHDTPSGGDGDRRRTAGASFGRWLTVGVAAYAGWLVANTVFLLVFPLLGALRFLGGAWGRAAVRAACLGFIRAFFLGYLPLVGVYRLALDAEGRERLRWSRGVLIAANHSSWLDALILVALVPRARVVVGRSYTRVPLVGRAMGWIGCVEVNRGRPETVLEAVRDAVHAVGRDENVVVFPEGTRSPRGRLGRFFDGFFRISIDSNAPVVPVILHYSHPFLGPGAENFLTAKRALLTIDVLQRVAPEDKERGTDLGHRVRREMRASLRQLEQRVALERSERHEP